MYKGCGWIKADDNTSISIDHVTAFYSVCLLFLLPFLDVFLFVSVCTSLLSASSLWPLAACWRLYTMSVGVLEKALSSPKACQMPCSVIDWMTVQESFAALHDFFGLKMKFLDILRCNFGNLPCWHNGLHEDANSRSQMLPLPQDLLQKLPGAASAKLLSLCW